MCVHMRTGASYLAISRFLPSGFRDYYLTNMLRAGLPTLHHGRLARRNTVLLISAAARSEVASAKDGAGR